MTGSNSLSQTGDCFKSRDRVLQTHGLTTSFAPLQKHMILQRTVQPIPSLESAQAA
jgi:hypothetical protein